MIALLWSLLNILIFLYFVYLLIGFVAIGRRIFRPGFEVISSIILVLGVVGVVTAGGKDDRKRVIPAEGDEISTAKLIQVKLEDDLSYNVNMRILFSQDSQKYIENSGTSTMYGLTSGFGWEHYTTSIDHSGSDGKATYLVTGGLKWQLFGIEIYTQHRDFRGTLEQ